jgi:hypothetical protein
VRRSLNPRWYAAARIGYQRFSAAPGGQSYEFVAGFRPNTYQLIKFGYTVQQGAEYSDMRGNIAAVEFVTSFRAISLAKD